MTLLTGSEIPRRHYVHLFLPMLFALLHGRDTKAADVQNTGVAYLNNILIAAPKGYVPYSGSVAAGANLALNECHHQFQWELWDCPVNMHYLPGYKTRHRATREAAFTRAIGSAGVTYTLLRNCSSGNLQECQCHRTLGDNALKRGWHWSGCADNFMVVERLSQLFVDSWETGKDAQAMVNMHNNAAGRKAVDRNMDLLCKCHGVSGSCTTKTCWRHLSSFRSVGMFLKRKYVRAVNVDFQNGALQETTGSRTRSEGQSIRRSDLVYLYPSPDFCRYNGTYRTLDRRCSGASSKTSMKKVGTNCRKLCTDCGLRVAKTYSKVQNKCDCKFHWCCEVQCKMCTEKEEVFTCIL